MVFTKLRKILFDIALLSALSVDFFLIFLIAVVIAVASVIGVVAAIVHFWG